MTRVAVVSRLRAAIGIDGGDEFAKPELLYDFPIDDQSLAEAKAFSEARSRLDALVDQKKGIRDDLEFPWLEEIVVCPLISGIGRGGSDYIALGDRSLTITVGMA